MSQRDSTRTISTNADPTEATTVRRGWVREFNRRWRDVRGAVRQRLRADGQQLLTEREEAMAVSEFRRFLRREMEDAVLEHTDMRTVRSGSHWTGQRVRDAYRRGLRVAARRLRTAGVDEADAARATNDGHTQHRETLRGEYLAVYADVEDVLAAVRKDATRTFRDHVRQSAAIGATIDAVNGRLDAIGQTRTQAIANTRVTETANAAALTAYELAGVEALSAQPETQPRDTRTNAVDCCRGHATREQLRANQEGAGQVEFVTAGDDRVCPECASLAGITFTVSQVQENQDSLHPPIHPSCRCYLYPLATETGGETTEAVPMR